jgi:hypothetical protein
VLYYIRPGTPDVLTAVEAEGYEQVWHRQYGAAGPPIFLDLFARGEPPGTEVAVNGGFADAAAGWSLPATGSELVDTQDGRSQLVVRGEAGMPAVATTVVPAGGGLYDATVSVRSDLPPQALVLSIACLDGRGQTMEESLDDDGLGRSADASRTERLAVVCPEGTAQLRVSLGIAAAPGEVTFEGLRLFLQPTT